MHGAHVARWLAALLVASASPRLVGGQNSFHHDPATDIRGSVLSQYDKHVPPTSTGAPVEVGLQVRVYKIRSVSIAEARLSLQVWWRLWWVDERLTWRPEEHGNVSSVPFLAASFASPEVSEIWLPELTVYNAIEPIARSLDTTYAIVSSNGTVFWSRPGPLELTCKFRGLVDFPFDTLGCDFEVGGWALSGLRQGLMLYDGGLHLPDPATQEATAGSSYQEYSLVSLSVSLSEFYYPCCTSEPWPIARYSLTLERAAGLYYRILIIVPACLLTLLSFAVFWLSFEVGERLGFGITLILATEVSDGGVPIQTGMAMESNDCLRMDGDGAQCMPLNGCDGTK